MSITPFSETPPDRILSSAPSIDLDMFMFRNILEGPDDVDHTLPSFSRRFGDCYMLLVKVMMEIGSVEVELNPEFFHEATKAGHIIRERQCPVWKVSSKDGKVGYGRSFEEAICKILIVAKYG